MNKSLILGSHVDMNKKNGFLVGSVKQAIRENANTFMIFTGPPQSSARTALEELKIAEFKLMCQENGFALENLIVHAPYIINLANPVKPETVTYSKDFFKKELERVLAIGINIIVLHPGAAVGGSKQDALDTLIASLDEVLAHFIETPIKIALETMSGKGTEICTSFDELAYVINRVKYPEHVGVCFDTCHVSDSGYDLNNNLDDVLNEFNSKIGFEKLYAIHLNDSKNPCGAKKDRHENIGYGMLGFETICQFLYHDKIIGTPTVLETPYADDFCPYEKEIAMLKAKKFIDWK